MVNKIGNDSRNTKFLYKKNHDNLEKNRESTKLDKKIDKKNDLSQPELM
jgi:hypothetical protein